MLKRFKKFLQIEFNIPNIITLTRLPLLVLFIYFYNYNKNISVLILIASCITDIADGYVARKFNMITNFGKILDPFCDKLTQVGILLCLSGNDYQLLNLTLMFLLCEGSIIFFGIMIIQKEIRFVFSDELGKLVTIMFYVIVFSYFILEHYSDIALNYLNTAIGLIAITSEIRLINYVYKYLKRSR